MLEEFMFQDSFKGIGFTLEKQENQVKSTRTSPRGENMYTNQNNRRENRKRRDQQSYRYTNHKQRRDSLQKRKWRRDDKNKANW